MSVLAVDLNYIVHRLALLGAPVSAGSLTSRAKASTSSEEAQAALRSRRQVRSFACTFRTEIQTMLCDHV